MALDDPAVLKRDGALLVVPEVNPLARVTEDVARARVKIGALIDKLLEVLNVVRRDFKGEETKSESSEV